MGRRRDKNQVLENLTLTDAGAKGKAVGHAEDGRVVFVTGAIPGDVIDARVTKKRKAYYEATPVEIHTYSDKRTEPKCEHFGTCGGCKWQNMDYKYQLEYKQNEVINNITRIGHIELPEITPILGSAEQYFYRNKMEFSFSDTRWMTLEEIQGGDEINDRNACGFHIPGRWDKILDVKSCYLQEDPSNDIRLETKKFAEENGYDFFNPYKQTGFLRTMMVRTSSTGDIMVVIQFAREDVEQREAVLNNLAEKFPNITALMYTINSKGNDSIYDLDIISYKGQDHIFEEMEGLRFKIGPKSFYQTNSKQAYELYKITRDFAGLTGNEIVYDLYTGTGTIAQFVAKKAKKVVGVEAVPDAIADAKINAENNGIDNTVFYAGDMKDVFNDAFINENGMPDIIITDPPRDGMHKNVVAKILEIGAPKIVYVSCNSATQARDLALMDEMYKVTRIQPVDMFPQTHHVENVVLLEKR
ncbi:MAG: 23S rRNA (uracil(1939)-C(5))-methyltransferase RlmD [Ichthyobacteriaceae bacterium]|nr:23S rRNA (uracil(1939)-C(5))-methyltransferase RlmD [Ichthyobacteriaceae bacterium]